jgi:hypothetical protein
MPSNSLGDALRAKCTVQVCAAHDLVPFLEQAFDLNRGFHQDVQFWALFSPSLSKEYIRTGWLSSYGYEVPVPTVGTRYHAPLDRACLSLD